MDDGFKARNVVLATGRLVEFEHAHEHGRHHLTQRDLVLLDQPEVVLGIEAFHHHDRRPDHVHS